MSAATITAYKAFDEDWKCRDYQFEVGKTYTHEGVIGLCRSGFHACEVPLDVWTYYPPTTSKFAIVELGGVSDERRDDSKRVGNSITIKASVDIAGLVKAQIEWVRKNAKTPHATKTRECASASGDSGHASASGDYGHASASGYYGHASASGDYGCSFSGFDGKAKAGANGAFAICWYDATNKRARIVSANVGENGIKADTWYRVNDGALVECDK